MYSNGDEIFDRFPINILESTGYIEREPFGLMVHTVKIWYSGRCVLNERIDGVIKGEIEDNEMYITLRNMQLESYISNSFSFSEISHNKDRVYGVMICLVVAILLQRIFLLLCQCFIAWENYVKYNFPINVMS